MNFISRSGGNIDKQKKDKINDAIVNFVVSDNSHFDVVEKPAFRNLLFVAEPNYIVPSNTTIIRKIDLKVHNP